MLTGEVLFDLGVCTYYPSSHWGGGGGGGGGGGAPTSMVICQKYPFKSSFQNRIVPFFPIGQCNRVVPFLLVHGP